MKIKNINNAISTNTAITNALTTAVKEQDFSNMIHGWEQSLAQHGFSGLKVGLWTKHPSEDFYIVVAIQNTNTIYVTKFDANGTVDRSFGSIEKGQFEAVNGIIVIPWTFKYTSRISPGEVIWKDGGGHYSAENASSKFYFQVCDWEPYGTYDQSSARDTQFTFSWDGRLLGIKSWESL